MLWKGNYEELTPTNILPTNFISLFCTWKGNYEELTLIILLIIISLLMWKGNYEELTRSQSFNQPSSISISWKGNYEELTLFSSPDSGFTLYCWWKGNYEELTPFVIHIHVFDCHVER